VQNEKRKTEVVTLLVSPEKIEPMLHELPDLV
jgi:hypothetical protein